MAYLLFLKVVFYYIKWGFLKESESRRIEKESAKAQESSI